MMRYPTLAIILGLLSFAHGTAYLSSSPSPTITSDGCQTATAVGGTSCTATPTGCWVIDCIVLSTLTQPCTCPTAIATTTQCLTTCQQGCSTTYLPVFQTWPCYTITDSWTYTDSDTATETGSKTKSKSKTLTGTGGTETESKTKTKPWYGNTTVTVTTISTISTCPAKKTCHGQTTTWTGTEGPSSCSEAPTCTCVLPGGTSTTIVGATTTTTMDVTVGPGGRGTGSTSANSAARTTSSGLLQSGGASKGGVSLLEGWLGVLGMGLLAVL